jgi:hypothetical protein
MHAQSFSLTTQSAGAQQRFSDKGGQKSAEGRKFFLPPLSRGGKKSIFAPPPSRGGKKQFDGMFDD